MRDQYAGDVSDLLKFLFLRALTGQDRRLGIAWYYVPEHEDQPNGGHLEWRDEPEKWSPLDELLFDSLSSLPERSVAALEEMHCWGDKFQWPLFYRDPVPPATRRDEWAHNCASALDDSTLVFLDPDDGLGKADLKHATISEVRFLIRPHRPVVLITFPPFNVSHKARVETLHRQLMDEAPVERVVTLRISIMVPARPESTATVPRTRWFTVINPDLTIIQRMHQFETRLSALPGVTVHYEDGILGAPVLATAETRPQYPAGELRTYRCCIPGCDTVFVGGRGGWDAHVGSLRTHPDWSPEITNPSDRRNEFRKRFPDFFST